MLNNGNFSYNQFNFEKIFKPTLVQNWVLSISNVLVSLPSKQISKTHLTKRVSSHRHSPPTPQVQNSLL